MITLNGLTVKALSPSSCCALLVAALAAACTIERGDVRTPSGEPPEADTTRVRIVMEAIALAFNDGDLGALDTLYHDSVLVYEGGAIDRGWERYRNDHLGPELAMLAERRLVYEDIEVQRVGTAAWSTFRFTLQAVRDGQPLSISGVGTMVFRRIGGRWLVTHSHTSSRRAAD